MTVTASTGDTAAPSGKGGSAPRAAAARWRGRVGWHAEGRLNCGASGLSSSPEASWRNTTGRAPPPSAVQGVLSRSTNVSLKSRSAMTAPGARA